MLPYRLTSYDGVCRQQITQESQVCGQSEGSHCVQRGFSLQDSLVGHLPHLWKEPPPTQFSLCLNEDVFTGLLTLTNITLNLRLV